MAVRIDLPTIPQNIAERAGRIDVNLGDTALLLGQAALLVAGLSGNVTRFDDGEYKSYLGTDVYNSITLGDVVDNRRNRYIDQLGNVQTFTPIRFHECEFSINLGKNIVETSILGRNDTEKEFIANNPAVITVTGRLTGGYEYLQGANPPFIFTNLTGQFPDAYATELANISRIGATIPIINKKINQYFGITHVVITNVTFETNRGNINYQPFTLEMISDRPTELVFTERDLNDVQRINDLLGINT